MFHAPAAAKPGMRIQVALPVSSKERSCSYLNVIVPPEYREGKQLSVLSPNGQRLVVQVPAGAQPGTKAQVSFGASWRCERSIAVTLMPAQASG